MIESGGPILRPGILEPDQPRSVGESLNILNVPIESLSLTRRACLSGSGGNLVLLIRSRPLIIGALSPGHMILSTPIIKNIYIHYLI